MQSIKISWVPGKEYLYPKGISLKKAFYSLKNAPTTPIVAGQSEGLLIDLNKTLEKDQEIKLIAFESELGLEILRHSTCHIMAQAVQRLYPDAKPTIGPVIGEKFYYDFERGQPFKEEDLIKIETEMKKISEERLDFSLQERSLQEAQAYFINNPYKLEILKDIEQRGEMSVTFYKQGDFTDLCRGPHISNTQQSKHFKLLTIAGAYWRSDKTKQMLQRIYGTAFYTDKELKSYLSNLDALKKRDHRKLGKELNLFHFEQEAPGFPFWQKKGTLLYRILENFIQKQNELHGYIEVKTPILLNQELWEKSGHYEHFRENMYFTKIEKRNYTIKPMNCPGHCLIYKQSRHSYRELPIRLSEFGLVHRHELSGVLHGLFRVRNFVQDDGHIFCMRKQLQTEVLETLKHMVAIYKHFGFKEYLIYVATQPDNFIGDNTLWEESTAALTEALKSLSLEYKIKEKEGAFYGPKIEFNIKDIFITEVAMWNDTS